MQMRSFTSTFFAKNVNFMSLKIGLVFIRVAVTSLSKDFLEVTCMLYGTYEINNDSYHNR